jgi:hypothetical protein
MGGYPDCPCGSVNHLNGLLFALNFGEQCSFNVSQLPLQYLFPSRFQESYAVFFYLNGDLVLGRVCFPFMHGKRFIFLFELVVICNAGGVV